jgi:hypothetical protein
MGFEDQQSQWGIRPAVDPAPAPTQVKRIAEEAAPKIGRKIAAVKRSARGSAKS